MTVPFPEPTAPAGSRTEVFLRYLDFFRGRLADRLRDLPDSELRPACAVRLDAAGTAQAPDLRERRWLDWGFEGNAFDDPWGDHRDDRWYVAPEETLDGLLAD